MVRGYRPLHMLEAAVDLWHIGRGTADVPEIKLVKQHAFSLAFFLQKQEARGIPRGLLPKPRSKCRQRSRPRPAIATADKNDVELGEDRALQFIDVAHILAEYVVAIDGMKECRRVRTALAKCSLHILATSNRIWPIAGPSHICSV